MNRALSDHQVPRTPRELAGHRCINYRHVRSGGLCGWDFEENGRPFEVRVEGRLVFNNADLIREAALAGQGVAYVYEDEVMADIDGGRLKRILDRWCPTFPGYYLYHPSRRQTPLLWLRSLARSGTNAKPRKDEYICRAWTKEPERFTLNALQQMPGWLCVPKT